MTWPNGASPTALDKVIARAMADLGWFAPVSALPVCGMVQPVVVLSNTQPNFFVTAAEQAITRGTIWGITVPDNVTLEVMSTGMTMGSVAATGSLGSFIAYFKGGPVTGSGTSVPWSSDLSTAPGAPQIGELLCGFMPPRAMLLPSGATVNFMYIGPSDATGKAYMQLAGITRPA